MLPFLSSDASVPPPALHLTVAVLHYLPRPDLPVLTLSAESHAFDFTRLCPFLPSKHLLIFQGSALPAHSLQGFTYRAPTLTPAELTTFFFWLHLRIILPTPL